jgi:hypothetical protein
MLRITRLVLIALAAMTTLIMAVLAALLVSTFAQAGAGSDLIRIRFPPFEWAMPLHPAQWALALVLLMLAIGLFVFVRLFAMVRSVSGGEPFSHGNARLLKQVGWALLAIQLCDLLFGIVARRVEVAFGEQVTTWTPSVAGWLSVLLVFVLARIFEQGARMRDDLALTV